MSSGRIVRQRVSDVLFCCLDTAVPELSCYPHFAYFALVVLSCYVVMFVIEYYLPLSMSYPRMVVLTIDYLKLKQGC